MYFLALLVSGNVIADDFFKDQPRSALTIEQLQTLAPQESPLSMDVFTLHGVKKELKQALQGRFQLSAIDGQSNLKLTEKSDVYLFEQRTRTSDFTDQRRTLPELNIEFIQAQNSIVPVKRNLQLTTHPHWDYIVGVGNIWQESNDNNYARIALPFALVEKNQNCVHNGVLSFLINEKRQTTHFYYQISSETCLYYKVDMWGKGKTAYQDIKIENNEEVINAFLQEQQHQLVEQPINSLVKKSAKIKWDQLSLNKHIKASDMTSYGVIYNDEHYASRCQTRFGDYPFCSQLVLPSYSTAKSIFAGISMLYLAKIYPEIFDEKISDWVKECQGENWRDVTFSHLLNMSTGNYQSLAHSSDEGAEHSQIFFKAATNQEKIHYSCYQFSKQSRAGKEFVYHSSDTYLLGVALDAYLKEKMMAENRFKVGSLFDFIFKQKIWPALHLSSVAYSTRQTNDKFKQPFTGYGLFFTRDDIAKLTKFLMNEYNKSSALLDSAQLYETLSRNVSAKDMTSQYPFIHYINGFWKQNVTTLLQCEKETWLPYMLGYGGITIVLAADNLQYYYFSDSNHYIWRDAIKTLHNLTSLCRQ